MRSELNSAYKSPGFLNFSVTILLLFESSNRFFKETVILFTIFGESVESFPLVVLPGWFVKKFKKGIFR